MAVSNGVIMQFFHWYIPADGTLWNELAGKAKDLDAAGFTAVWLPPCTKGAAGGLDVGYGLYDLFDLGEFEQKGSIRTKYGTKQELLAALTCGATAGAPVLRGCGVQSQKRRG